MQLSKVDHLLNLIKIVYLASEGVRLSEVIEMDIQWAWQHSSLPQEESCALVKMALREKPTAFLFHNCCWELLMKHFDAGEFNLNKLFEVCRQVPRLSIDSRMPSALRLEVNESFYTHK